MVSDDSHINSTSQRQKVVLILKPCHNNVLPMCRGDGKNGYDQQCIKCMHIIIELNQTQIHLTNIFISDQQSNVGDAAVDNKNSKLNSSVIVGKPSF